MFLCETLIDMFEMFLKKHKITHQSAACKLCVSRSHLTQVISGNKMPSLRLAQRIEEMTQGAVMASSWVTPKVPARSGDA